MELIKTHEWFYTSDNEPRGYIDPHGLRELWFHTGTTCNLACPFCLEGSRPGDKRLQPLRLDDAVPYIDEALGLGVEQFSFTGGEPFVIRDFIRILAYASEHRPCLVLTNGTDPLLKRADALAPLAASQHPISFRISLDAPDSAIHDQGRGTGAFAKALEGLALLNSRGFKISVARQMAADEDTAAVEEAYRALFADHDLPATLPIIAFPDFHLPGVAVATPQITEDCMTRYQTEADRRAYMCAFSKMVVKQDGVTRIYACTLVDDDDRYAFDGTLAESLKERVILAHHRCYSCFSMGASCSEIQD